LDQVNRPAPDTFLPNLEAYEKIYCGQPVFEGAPASAGIPWEVGQAQPRLRELEALGAVSGDVLDIGCGLGDNAIYLASRGHRVTGLDGSVRLGEQRRQPLACRWSIVTDLLMLAQSFRLVGLRR
jgi:SAM-dependent methyltransferase